MTIYAAELSRHCLPFTTQLKPTSRSHHKSAINCRNHTPQYSTSPRITPKFKVSAETRPAHLQSYGFNDAHLMKEINRRRTSGKYSECLHLLEKWVKKGNKPDPLTCQSLISAFLRSEDVAAAARVIEILESHGEPADYSYKAMIKGFCKLNKVELANQVLNRMKARGFSPDTRTYNVIIGSHSRRGEFGLALKVLYQLLEDNCKPSVGTFFVFLMEVTAIQRGIDEEMKLLDDLSAAAARVMEILESHGEPASCFYNAMVTRFCKSNKVEWANQVLNRMRARGFSPDTDTYNTMIQTLSRRGEFGLALKILDQLLDNCEPRVGTYASLMEATAIKSGIDEVTKLLDDLLARGHKPDIRTHNLVIKGLCTEGRLDRAYDYIRRLPAMGCDPNSYSYDTVLKALLSRGRWYDGERLVTEMYSSGCEPNVGTHNILISSLCREGTTDEAINVLKLMMENGLIPNNYSFDPLITTICREGRVDLVMGLYEYVICTGCFPVIELYEYVISLCKCWNTDEAMELFQMLGKIGCPPDVSSYNTMFSALWRNTDTTRAFRMVSDMIEKGVVDPDETTYNSLISCLCREGMVDEAIELLGDMEVSGLQPTVISYNTVLLGLGKARRVRDRTRAFEMVLDMKGKGVDPDVITYSSLLSCLCGEGRVDEAIGLLGAMEGSGFQPTVIVYNTALLGLCKAHRLDDGIDMLAEMVEQGCRPNEITYITLIEGLGFAGWQTEATELANTLFEMNVLSKDSFKYSKYRPSAMREPKLKKVIHTGIKK